MKSDHNYSTYANSSANSLPGSGRPLMTKPHPFRSMESEVYIIKDNNLKRINEILKNSYSSKPNNLCKVNVSIKFF